MSQEEQILQSFTYTIERGKIQEFAQAIGDDHRIYYDVEAAQREGYRDIPIPPTFPTAIEMWAGNDFDALTNALNLNPMHVLHGEQTYQYEKTLCAGDTVDGETTVADVTNKGGMTLYTLETVLRHANDVALRSKAVIIERKPKEEQT